MVVDEECVVSNLVGEIKEEQQRRTNNKQQTTNKTTNTQLVNKPNETQLSIRDAEKMGREKKQEKCENWRM